MHTEKGEIPRAVGVGARFDSGAGTKRVEMNMYQVIDNKIAVTVNDWLKAGLTYNQFRVDSRNGFLTVLNRGLHGNTAIDLSSIKRPERRTRIESALGGLDEFLDREGIPVKEKKPARKWLFQFVPDLRRGRISRASRSRTAARWNRSV
jgi:hypothetical protein